MSTLAAPKTIVPVTDAELGSVLALLESLHDRPADTAPWPPIRDLSDLRCRVARDERESGLRWFACVGGPEGGLEGIAGYDPAASDRGGVVVLDGPVVWGDLRRRGIGSALLAHVTADARERLGARELHSTVGEGNLPGSQFLERNGFVLTELRRTLSCQDAHVRAVATAAEVSIVTPADACELRACAELLSRGQSVTGAAPAALSGVDDRRTIMRMALVGDRTVGFGLARQDLLEETVWIDHLVCDPGWRDQQIELALLAQLLGDSFQRPRVRVVKAELATAPGIDPRQIDVFEGMGFGQAICDLAYSRRETREPE